MKQATKVLLLCVFSFAFPILTFAESASVGDVQQAQKFLASLPPSCKGSYSVNTDGKVSVSYLCTNKSGQVAAGTIDMKDGKVTDVK